MKHPTIYNLSAAIPLFLLLAAPLASAQGANHPDIPPPLPENKWIKRTPLNYTELHTEFAEVLSCLYLPIGVLGSFWRYVLMALNVIDIGKLMVYRDNEDGNPLRFFGGCFTVGWSVFTVLASLKSQRECSGELNYSAFRNALNMDIASTICSALSGVMVIFNSGTYFSSKKFGQKFLSVGLTLSFLAVFILILQAPTLLISTANAAGVTKKLFSKSDRACAGEGAVAYISEIIITLFCCFLLYRNTRETRGAWVVIIGVLIVGALAIALGGMATLLLGKILGDPWGGYLTTKDWGKAFVGLTSVGMIMGVLLAVLGTWVREE